MYADEESSTRALSLVRAVKVRSRRTKACNGGPIDERGGSSDVSSEYVIDCMLNLERKKIYAHGRVLPEVFGTTERMSGGDDEPPISKSDSSVVYQHLQLGILVKEVLFKIN